MGTAVVVLAIIIFAAAALGLLCRYIKQAVDRHVARALAQAESGLRDTLAWYAERGNWRRVTGVDAMRHGRHWMPSDAHSDRGHRARQALRMQGLDEGGEA